MFYRSHAPGFNLQLRGGFMTLGTFLSLTLLPSCVGGEEKGSFVEQNHRISKTVVEMQGVE